MGHMGTSQVAQAGRDAVLGMAAILVPADMPRLLAALDELSNFPDEDVRQSVVIMLAGLTGLLSQKSCTEMLLPRIMRLLQDNAYLVRKVSNPPSTLKVPGSNLMSPLDGHVPSKCNCKVWSYKSQLAKLEYIGRGRLIKVSSAGVCHCPC